MFHRRVYELLQLRECHDFVKLTLDFLPAHSQNGTTQEGILAPGQLGVKPRPDLEQGADPSANLRPACGRLSDARKNLEQGGLSRAVAADQSQYFAFLYFQR